MSVQLERGDHVLKDHTIQPKTVRVIDQLPQITYTGIGDKLQNTQHLSAKTMMALFGIVGAYAFISVAWDSVGNYFKNRPATTATPLSPATPIPPEICYAVGTTTSSYNRDNRMTTTKVLGPDIWSNSDLTIMRIDYPDGQGIDTVWFDPNDPDDIDTYLKGSFPPNTIIEARGKTDDPEIRNKINDPYFQIIPCESSEVSLKFKRPQHANQLQKRRELARKKLEAAQTRVLRQAVVIAAATVIDNTKVKA